MKRSLRSDSQKYIAPKSATQNELGRSLALTIKKELTEFIRPVSEYCKNLWINKLYDSAPTRKELSFQRHQGKAAAKKELLIAPSGETETDEEIFCFIHSDFVLSEGVDIDHVFSHSSIRENQKRLLEFLNDPKRCQKEFVEGFLSTEGISELFRKEGTIIKGSGYFYRLCYNAVNNLLLLCHACNICKSDRDPLDWFKEQDIYFGDKFLEAVQQSGGLHQGVILSRVYQENNEILKLELSKDSAATNLYFGEGIGLGEFARNWFEKHFSEIVDVQYKARVEGYLEIKKDLSKIARLQADGDTLRAGKKLSVIKELISCTRKIYARIMEELSSRHSSTVNTSSDEERERVATVEDVSNTGVETWKINAELKKLRKLWKSSPWYKKEEEHEEEEELEEEEKYPQSIATDLRKLHEEDKLELSQWRYIYSQMKDYVEKRKSKNLALTHKEYMQEVERLFSTFSFKRLNAANEASKLLAEEKTRLAEEKVRLIEEENARLRKQFKEPQGGQTKQKSPGEEGFFSHPKEPKEPPTKRARRETGKRH